MAFNSDNVDLSSLSQVAPVDDDFEQLNLQSTYDEALKVNPAEHARVMDLSRQSGVPEFAVQSNPAEVEHEIKRSKFDFSDISKNSPATSKFLQSNLNNAIVGQNDIDVMREFEETLTGFTGRVKSAGSSLVQALAAMPADIAKGQSIEISELVSLELDQIDKIDRGESLGFFAIEGPTIRAYRDADPVERKVIRAELLAKADPRKLAGYTLGEEIKAAVEEQFQTNPEYAQEFWAGKVPQGFGSMLGFMITSTITRMTGARGGFAQIPTVEVASQQMGSAEFQQALESGASFEEAYKAGNVSQLIAPSEALPIARIFDRLDRAMKGEFKRRVYEMFEAGTEEAIQEAAQSIWSNIVASDIVAYDPERGMFTDTAEGAGVGFTVGALTQFMVSLIAGRRGVSTSDVDATVDSARREALKNHALGIQEQNTLNQINTSAQNSEMRQLDKEAFKQFVRETDGDNDTTVFIDPVQASLYLQTKTPDEIEADAGLQLLQEQVTEASETDTAITIPIAEFSAEIAGTEHFEQLRDSMTLSESSVPPVRQQQDKQAGDTYLNHLMDQAVANTEQFQQAQQIFEDVRQQLIDTGQLDKKDAGIAAQLIPAMMSSYAERTGVTVQEAYEQSGLSITGPFADEQARIQAARDEGLIEQPVDQNLSVPFEDGPVTLEDGTRISGFSDGTRNKFYGFTPTGEPFVIGRNAVDLDQNIVSETGRDTSVDKFRRFAAFDPDAVDSADLLAQGAVTDLGPRGDGGISTRKPTAKASKENPLQKNLVVGLAAAKKDRKSFEKNAAVIAEYTNFRPADSADTPDKVVNRFITHVKNNLLWLYDQVPADVRERSHLWYDGARNITDRWTGRFGVSDTTVAGVLAALSPQKDWFMNVSLAERVLDTYINHQDTPWSDEMTETAARIFGKPQYKEMVDRISGTKLSDHTNAIDIAAWIRTRDEAHNERGHRIVSPEGFFQEWAVSAKGARKKTGWGSLPEIAKAVAVIQDPSIENVSNRMGEMHKVRNFYNNIISPESEHGDVTIDTHAVAAGLLKPLAGASLEVMHNFGGMGIASSSLTGVKGTYGIYAEAYRKAAKERNILAREMQSITWEAVRGLFPAGYKSQQKNVDAIEAIWQKYRDGKLSLEKAREQINEHAGGITDPDWVGHTGELDAGKPDSSFIEELSGLELPRLEQSPTGGLGRGASGVDSQDTGRQASGPIGRVRSLLRRDGADASGQRGAYSRSTEADAAGNVTFTPSEELTAALTEANASAPTYVQTTDAQDFLAKITKAKGTNPHSAAVEIKSIDEYASGDYKLFLTEDGAAGFAVKSDGDIVSVFKDPESDIKGFVLSALSLAIEQGGNKLDAFDTVLPTLYSQMGFVARSRLPWVEEFAPENWDKSLFTNFNNGEPDVVLMSLDPDSQQLYTKGDGQAFDDWDEAAGLRDSFLDPAELEQDQGAQQARGFFDPKTNLIRLTEASDLSTFLHESAHFFLEMERRADTDLFNETKAWWGRNAEAVANEAKTYTDSTVTPEQVTQYLETGTTGDIDIDRALWRATHEQFARGFEAYLMEGKAPSIELRDAFRAFARWLVNIYKSITGLDVTLDDDMRQVFDSMLATQEQIAAAKARARVEPLFTDAAMAAMTEEEFTAYQEKQQKSDDKATETLRDKMIKQLRRVQQKWWNEEKSDFVDEETERLKKDRVHVAREELKNGDIKLDFATVKEMVGEQKEDKLGRKSVRIPAKLNGMTAKEHQGLHPDEAAALLGYNSGSEMLDDLIKSPSLSEAANAAAEERMIEKHGDIMNDGSIEKAADEAVANEERGELLLTELKALSRDTSVPKIDRKSIKDVARERIGKLSFREIFPGKYRAAELKAAAEAARLLAEGDKDGAARAKLRQVMNYYLGMEAAKAKQETAKIVERMTRYRKKKVQTEIMKSEGGHWEQIAKILSRFEFRKSASLKQVDATNESIQSWAEKRNEDHGDGLVLTNAVLNELYVTHWKNVPFTELQGIADSVKNIEHVARYANKMDAMIEEIEFRKLESDFIDSINENKHRFENKETRSRTADATAETFSERTRRWASQLSKVPFIAVWLDGGERVGLAHKILIQPLTNALDAKMRLMDEVAKPVNDLILNRSKEDQKRHMRKIWIPEINDHLYGHQVLAVALNVGNAGNLRKLLLGEGWADPQNDAEISIDNPKLQAILQHMTKSDWELVQAVWDQMELLYPQLAEVHRKTTGLTPPKVEAVPVETEFGTFEGGYYPVKYSRKRSHDAEKNGEKADAETESMFNNTASIQASVNAGATNERTGFYDRIHLSLDVIPDHFNETIHYITHHDAVRQINRVINSRGVADAITAVLGESEYKQLKPWLNDVAKDGRQQPVKTFMDEMFQRLRFGTTLGVMGFKASTGLMQLFGLMTTAGEVGVAPTLKAIYTTIGRSWYMKAVRRVLGSRDDMQTSWEFASERSKVLNHRVQTMDREIRNAMEKLTARKLSTRMKGIPEKILTATDKLPYLSTVQEASMKHIALIQTYMVDLPTWMAAYDKMLAESASEEKAVQYADWAVENLQGSGATKDMAGLLRNQNKIASTFTMFMTFFSSLGNLSRDLVKGARSGVYSPSSVAAKLMFFYTIPVFAEMVMRGDLFDEEEDDVDEFQKFMTALALYPTTSIPFVRDVASGLIGEYGYNTSPVASMLEKGITGVKGAVTGAVTDGEITKSQAKNAVKLGAAAVGVPGINQAWATGEHLYDVIENGEDFTISEGVFFGPERDK